MPFFKANFRGVSFLFCITSLTAHGQFLAPRPAPGPSCANLLQAQDAKAVPVCQAEVDDAERAPATEHLARIIASDNYGVALLAVAHQPRQSLVPFSRAVALLPQSTVKPDSLQWAVVFWHRATAYQQLEQWEHAASDLKTAEDTFSKGIAAAGNDAALVQHFAELRQRVSKQRADVLSHMGKHNEI